MLDKKKFEEYSQIAKCIAGHFGKECEVVVHDLTDTDALKSIAYIENGHITGRRVGDGASQVVLEQLKGEDSDPQDKIGYLTKTADGKIPKSSTVYMRDENGKIVAIISINQDITKLLMAQEAIRSITTAQELSENQPKKITQNVNDLLDQLIWQSVQLVGKPVALMTKEDKITAISFLNKHGAMLITKSGDKISNYFGISKYTLYSYIDSSEKG